MLHQLLKRFGLARTMALLTGAAVLMSIIITVLINTASEGRLSLAGVNIAIIVPLIVAPLFSYFQLRLIQQLDQAREALHQLSITDELTQALNRRRFVELAQQEFIRAGAMGRRSRS